ncbi:glucan 1-3-beta-glucosidase precursor [Apiospora phragmitis]|uniref:glucan 1,3-beta-glucosidase n=1 Tax=Apiospora phragmitis TaxID=2905665 RepID=A0ABR1UH27_9PEZI
MHVSSLLAGPICSAGLASATRTKPPTSYLDWKTFQGDGVNLGGWLIQEPFIDTAWWSTHCGADVADEWTCCANLGDQCGPVFEQRYATWFTTADIDVLAAAGLRVLRIPTTYQAWIDLPGSALHHGQQRARLREVATHAVTTHGMHVVLDLHGLPGGVNNQTIGERVGGLDWWYNETALAWSLKTVDAVLDFIQQSGSPQAFSLEPVNEPMDNPDDIGLPSALSDEAADWLLKYYHAVLDRVAAVNPQIPVMLNDGFKGPAYFAGNFTADQNIVFDVHYYYFNGRPAGSNNVTEMICADARGAADADDGNTFPVFTGEWAIETMYNNSLDARKDILNAGLAAFGKHTKGSAYWTGKVVSNEAVAGQGRSRTTGATRACWSWAWSIRSLLRGSVIRIASYQEVIH